MNTMFEPKGNIDCSVAVEKLTASIEDIASRAASSISPVDNPDCQQLITSINECKVRLINVASHFAADILRRAGTVSRNKYLAYRHGVWYSKLEDVAQESGILAKIMAQYVATQPSDKISQYHESHLGKVEIKDAMGATHDLEELMTRSVQFRDNYAGISMTLDKNSFNLSQARVDYIKASMMMVRNMLEIIDSASSSRLFTVGIDRYHWVLQIRAETEIKLLQNFYFDILRQHTMYLEGEDR